MKKFFVLSTVLFITTAVIYLTACNNNSSKPTTTAKEDSIKQVVERGKYLAEHVTSCMDCHSKRDFTKYSGPIVPGTEGGGGLVFDQKFGLPGVLYGKNITPDAETGIGSWTDEEILRAMTLGISKNGDTLFPLMPYISYNHMAKDDLLSIIAYIKTLKPIKNKVPARQLMVPIAMAYPAPALQPSVDANVRPPASDKIKYGAYLTMSADCANCHSPLTPQGPDMTKKFAGGYVFDLGTNKVASANITSDSTTGIGAWTEDMFLAKFTPYRDATAYNHDAGKQNTIMPLSVQAGMTDDDLKAIYAFLKTTTPIKNMVEKFPK